MLRPLVRAAAAFIILATGIDISANAPSRRCAAAVSQAMVCSLPAPGFPAAGPGSLTPEAERPLADILTRAAEWVERFADDSMFVVAEERYEQEYRHADRTGEPVERRTLRSEIVSVRTPVEEVHRGFPWVQFRDVQEVDGEAVGDHQGRLERLFRDPSGASYAQARALVEESARFNIGPAIRTVNVPAFALFFLVARNQPRFRFDWKGEDTVDGVQVALVGYRERERPTIIRSPDRQDRVAKGSFWIDAMTGRVMRTRLDVEGERHWRTEIEVDYGRDARLDAWVPLVMRERHARDSTESITCTATYSNFRRFETTARIVVPR